MFLAVCGTGSAFSQLRVANSFGQALNVETGGKTILIPDKGMAVFPTRVRTALLSCQTPDNKIKFVVSRKVSRAGLVEILSGDNIDAKSVVEQNDVSVPVISDKPDTIIVSKEEPSLEGILKGTVLTDYDQAPANISASDLNAVTEQITSQPPSIMEPIKIKYFGTFTLKIISDEGQGTELLGLNDSIDNSSPRTCTLNVRKGSDLLIKFVFKDDEKPNQTVWPYGEIIKHINLEDSVCEISDFDVDALALCETTKVRFRLESENYKVIIKPTNDRLVSLRYQDASGPIALPIGKSYIEAAYTDPKGQFHPRVFLPISVTHSDRIFSVTDAILAKSLVVKNW